MSAYVIDTNVAVVANGCAQQAGAQCVLACIEWLERVYMCGVVVLDNEMMILEEYMQNLSMAGQPGPGDVFMKWVWQNQAVQARCERVAITPRGSGNHDFEEFPADPALANFHFSDRKFVAVALASRHNPKVLNAVDSDWWDYRNQLEQHGVRICFLCPAQFAGR